MNNPKHFLKVISTTTNNEPIEEFQDTGILLIPVYNIDKIVLKDNLVIIFTYKKVIEVETAYTNQTEKDNAQRIEILSEISGKVFVYD